MFYMEKISNIKDLFQNIPHCRNNSKIYPTVENNSKIYHTVENNSKIDHTVGIIPKYTTLSSIVQNIVPKSYKQRKYRND